MSKVSEAYLAYMYDKDMPKKKGKARPREKRTQPQIDGQLSFFTDEKELKIDNSGEEVLKERRKQDSLSYYDAFYEMLRRYGKFNVYYCLWDALCQEHPGQDAINALNYHYDGKPENVKSALDRSRYWLSQSRMKFRKACDRVDLFDVDSRYNEAFRDKDRRTKYYSYIRRERKKIEDGKTTVLYTPNDFEDNYQRNRTVGKKAK